MKCYLILLYLTLSAIFSSDNFAQKSKIDSLLNVLKSSKEDTVKVRLLNELSKIQYKSGKYDLAIAYAEDAKKNAVKCNYKVGLANSYSNIGISYNSKGEHFKALENNFESLKIRQQINDKPGISASYNNIGSIYRAQGDYSKALEMFFKSLKVKEELNDIEGMAATFNNIGIVYSKQGDYEKTLEYYNKSLKIRESVRDKLGISSSFNNIGLIYFYKKEFSEALEYFKKSLELKIEIHDKKGMANSLSNMGLSYSQMKDYSQALNYYFRSLKIMEDIGDKRGQSALCENIASSYFNQDNIESAYKYTIKSIEIAKKIKALEVLKSNYELLSKIFESKGMHSQSLNAYKQFIIYRDSLFNEENIQKMVRYEMNFEFEKKTVADSIQHIEEQKVKDAQIQMQDIQIKYDRARRNVLYGGIILILMFSGILLNRFRVVTKQKQIIEKQKIEVEAQKTETEFQKHIVEEKNKSIIDSITYAKRLQEAILPPPNMVKEYLKESFVLYKPKDIVAGDFYWMETIHFDGPKMENHQILFAVADCTGHGVPGAMVSVVCHNALNSALKEYKILEPHKILDKVNELVEESFSNSENEVKDGMDISLCRIDFNKMNLSWSGANNPLWIIRNGELLEFKPDKQPIGKFDHRKPFSLHEFDLQKGDTLYVFSDGYADQFGGNKGKKYKYSQFKEKLLEIQGKSMDEQKLILNDSFEAWRGNLEQIDDVTIIGVRI